MTARSSRLPVLHSALCEELDLPHIANSPFTPVVMLVMSNVFMTFAWYGHLKYKSAPLAVAIVASWVIAFVEYCFAVPANRWGSSIYSVAQLKTMQEVITLSVFAGFSVLVLKQPLGWNHLAGFVLIACGAGLIFRSST